MAANRKKKQTTAQTRAAANKTDRENQKKRGILAFCIAILVLFLAILLGIWLLGGRASAACVPNGVYAAGIDLSGMTREAAVTALTAATDNTYARTAMVIETPDGEVTLSPAQTGAKLNAEAAADAAIALPHGNQVLNLLPYLTLDTDAIREAVDALADTYTRDLLPYSYELSGTRPDPVTAESESQTLTFTAGRAGYGLDADALYQDILTAYGSNLFTVTAECNEQIPESLDLDPIYDELCTAPVDAILDKETYTITPEIYGYAFDLDAAKAWLASAEPGETRAFPLSPVAPAVTSESLVEYTFPDTLASADTYYKLYETDRNTNLSLACAAIDGMVLEPGDEFSFNDTLGERTEEKGYKYGTAYIDGGSQPSIGGGICQVASTLYYCALYADLEIWERAGHMFMPDYLPAGMDATVYWDLLDMRFCNTSGHPIRIEASMSDGYVHVRLLGTDDKDYYVQMEYQILDEIGPYVETFRCKYDKATDLLISRTHEDYTEYDDTKPDEDTQTPPPESSEPSEPSEPDILHGGVSQDGGD